MDAKMIRALEIGLMALLNDYAKQAAEHEDDGLALSFDERMQDFIIYAAEVKGAETALR